MSLHEQCLLKYLMCPDAVLLSTQALIENNSVLEEQFVKQIVAKYSTINYTKGYA